MGQVTLGKRTFSLDDKLLKKLGLLIDRVEKPHPKQDSTLGVDGKTGSGKSNAAIVLSGYVRERTGRPIHLFFATKSALKFAQATEKQLIILDEPSLDLLAKDWATGLSKDFLRLLNTMRRKRHFFVICFANFWHFPEHLVVDRLNGLLHMKLKELGRAVWIRSNKLEILWNDYKKLHKRNFLKHKSFNCYFPYIMEDGTFEALDITVEDTPHATYDDYERLKDKSIGDINSKQKIDKQTKKLMELRLKIGKANPGRFGITKEQLASLLGIDSKRLRDWANIDLNDADSMPDEPNSLGKTNFEASAAAEIINQGQTPPLFDEEEEEEPSNKTKNDHLVPPDDENEL